jgi:hypothetical protein
MRYFSGSRDRYSANSPEACASWGGYQYFIEVDDQYVTRQVKCYENGNVLRYDRNHWCDDFGYMFVGKFSRKEKAGRGMVALTAAEFEKVWVSALASPLWEEQRARSRQDEWGSWEERVNL